MIHNGEASFITARRENGPEGQMSELRLEDRGWRAPLGTAFLLLTLAATVTLVDPRRELLTWDDGWAYARSVALLLKTGHYKLDIGAANTPVQIALAAFASKIFGYSLTS